MGANGMGPNGMGANGLAPAGVEFEILANYNPLPEGESYASQKGDAATDEDESRGDVVSGGQHGPRAPRKAGTR